MVHRLPPAVAEVVPLHAVDEVVAEQDGDGWRIHARKVISNEDPYMSGHFPGVTVYPGLFVVESVRQAVAEGLGVPCDITSVRSARFLTPLVTNDVMIVEATACPRDNGMLAVTAGVTVERGNIPAAKVELLLRAPRAADAAA